MNIALYLQFVNGVYTCNIFVLLFPCIGLFWYMKYHCHLVLLKLIFSEHIEFLSWNNIVIYGFSKELLALFLPLGVLTQTMSGGGIGRGSGRAHFRSKLGCCICGTKSSSSRFTASERYAEHFGPCFGEVAARRSGDLCNACVLCVKRWLQRGKHPGYFSQVSYSPFDNLHCISLYIFFAICELFVVSVCLALRRS